MELVLELVLERAKVSAIKKRDVMAVMSYMVLRYVKDDRSLPAPPAAAAADGVLVQAGDSVDCEASPWPIWWTRAGVEVR